MSDSPGPRLRVTVLGCSTAAPHQAAPAAGYLIQWGDTSLLLDAGQGVIRNLQRVLDPRQLTAVVIGHMHADHYLDLVGLRYLYPWGERARDRLRVHLPPDGRARLDAMAGAISERAGFFDAAFDAVDYDPTAELTIGELRVRFVEGRHYVPAWGVVVESPDGARLAYTGDTGPSTTVEDAVRGADLLLVESSIRSTRHDDQRRGHLTAPEAIALAREAEVRYALLVHYGPERLPELEELCAAAGSWVRPAIEGLTITVSPADGRTHEPDAAPTAGRASA
jgi:ribonuclease BN (tRNA processing enzyme)